MINIYLIYIFSKNVPFSFYLQQSPGKIITFNIIFTDSVKHFEGIHSFYVFTLCLVGIFFFFYLYFFPIKHINYTARRPYFATVIFIGPFWTLYPYVHIFRSKDRNKLG